MHFAIYVILRDKKLENFNYREFEEDFSNKFCDCGGGHVPEIEDVCNWFQLGQLGGRDADNLIASNGIVIDDEDAQENHYSVCEIQDLIETGELFEPYAFILDDDYIEVSNDRYQSILKQIRDKTLRGTLVSLDCHM